MLTFKTFSTRLTVLLAAGSLAAACGDNWHGGGGGPIDAPPGPDADHSMPDAEIDSSTPTATVSGTFAVTDVTLLDPSTAAVGGVAGGSVGITWSDLTDGNDGGQVIAGTSPVNGCLVTEFSPGHAPHALLDEGGISISDNAANPGGLLKTVGGCSFQAAFGGYVCISNAGNETMAAADLFALTASHSTVAYIFANPAVDFGMQAPVNITSISRANTGLVTVVTATPHGYANGDFVTIAGVTDSTFNTPVPGPGFPIQVGSPTVFVYQTANTTVATDTTGTAALPSQKIVTSVLNVNGFANAAFNSGASAFPILKQLSANTVLTLNTAPADNACEGAAASCPTPAATTYAVLNGFTPIPKGGIANADFLGTGSIDIMKGAGTEWPAINTTVDVPGQGWSLSDSGDPTAFPATGAVTFGCGNDTPASSGDDTCGDGSTALVQALIVSGKATKQDVGGTCDTVTAHTCTTSSNGRQGLPCAADTDCALFPFQMPTEDPATDTWVEWQCAFIGAHSATMPAAAVDAINGISPTRIETRVINAAGAILQDGLNSTNLLVGHAFVGHTDPT